MKRNKGEVDRRVKKGSGEVRLRRKERGEMLSKCKIKYPINVFMVIAAWQEIHKSIISGTHIWCQSTAL